MEKDFINNSHKAQDIEEKIDKSESECKVLHTKKIS